MLWFGNSAVMMKIELLLGVAIVFLQSVDSYVCRQNTNGTALLCRAVPSKFDMNEDAAAKIVDMYVMSTENLSSWKWLIDYFPNLKVCDKKINSKLIYDKNYCFFIYSTLLVKMRLLGVYRMIYRILFMSTTATIVKKGKWN